MEGGSSTRRHTHSHTTRLLQQMYTVCPSEGSQISGLLREHADILAALDWLVCTYNLQDREIHRLVKQQCEDPCRLPLAEREEVWLRQNGARTFFDRRRSAHLEECHPEVFQPDVFMMAWNCFQMLLMVVHIDYMTRTLGHVPSQGEYLNPDLYSWFGRIAARFAPVRENEKSSDTLH